MTPTTSSENSSKAPANEVPVLNQSRDANGPALTVQAAVFAGVSGEKGLCQLTVPELGESEVLVRVSGCTICGSDLHSFHGRRTVPVPTILGHEIVGEIVDMG
ncbi:MAG: alcohol dehydrogenase catalytic domain-containing protein, partial [Schlesneria sp.]